ncbi:hypothetical protein HDU97_001644 [Phlyctochytrium planicorne]|nr:hypothetical protein HDU97_001644 [Phlyctochytrium planicorne]
MSESVVVRGPPSPSSSPDAPSPSPKPAPSPSDPPRPSPSPSPSPSPAPQPAPSPSPAPQKPDPPASPSPSQSPSPSPSPSPTPGPAPAPAPGPSPSPSPAPAPAPGPSPSPSPRPSENPEPSPTPSPSPAPQRPDPPASPSPSPSPANPSSSPNQSPSPRKTQDSTGPSPTSPPASPQPDDTKQQTHYVTTVYQGTAVTYTIVGTDVKTLWQTIDPTSNGTNSADSIAEKSNQSSLPAIFLFLFIGVVILGGILSLVWCFRTIWQFKSSDPDEREQRRKARVEKALRSMEREPHPKFLSLRNVGLWYPGTSTGRNIFDFSRNSRSGSRGRSAGSSAAAGTMKKNLITEEASGTSASPFLTSRGNNSLDSNGSSLRIPMETFPPRGAAPTSFSQLGDVESGGNEVDSFRGFEMARFEGDSAFIQNARLGVGSAGGASLPAVGAGAVAGGMSRESFDGKISSAFLSQHPQLGDTIARRSSFDVLANKFNNPRGTEDGGAGAGDTEDIGSRLRRVRSASKITPRVDTSGIYARSVHLPFVSGGAIGATGTTNNSNASGTGSAAGTPLPSGGGSSILPSPSAPGYVWLQSGVGTVGSLGRNNGKSGVQQPPLSQQRDVQGSAASQQQHQQLSALSHHHYALSDHSASVIESARPDAIEVEVGLTAGSADVSAASAPQASVAEIEAYHLYQMNQWASYGYDPGAYWQHQMYYQYQHEQAQTAYQQQQQHGYYGDGK